MERRKVLFRDGMSNDFLLIITDAPKEAIEQYCQYHHHMMEEGVFFEIFAPLKAKYYVKELLDSEVDDFEDVDIIGYDVVYDFAEYPNWDYRLIKLYAGMTGEFEIINTNAPDSVIKAQLTYTSALQEEREPVRNPYSIIEAMGYEVHVVACQDTCSVEDLENMSIDAEFDYYEY